MDNSRDAKWLKTLEKLPKFAKRDNQLPKVIKNTKSDQKDKK